MADTFWMPPDEREVGEFEKDAISGMNTVFLGNIFWSATLIGLEAFGGYRTENEKEA